MRRKRHDVAVVGFYKDHGKTKPITKPLVQLKRRKVVEDVHEFRGITPKEEKRPSIVQRLEDISEDLAMVQNNLQLLAEQRRQLLEEGSDMSAIDRQIGEGKKQVAILTERLRRL